MSRRAFTLLEVLVALAILGLGITSALTLMGTSSRAAVRARDVTEATFVAEEVMEELCTLNESELRAKARETGDWADLERRAQQRREGHSSALERPPEPDRYAYAVQVVADRNEPGLYRVDVEVTWPGSGETGLQLTTLRRFPAPETGGMPQ